MLSQETIATVKSTAPVLEAHGETLTRHFYARMFTENPEVAPFFNRANQQAGTQQRALAAAITAYAAHIDDLEALGGAVELIAQKHASLMIKPEHYPIVGANLLASIREVLGEAATDEIVDAWAEAYGFLADILIAREAQIYADTAAVPGGWEGFRPFTVARKVPESANITSFYLQPADGGALPEFAPGQYITVRVPTADGLTTMRNYSLSDRPGQAHLRISVKREEGAPDGYVSTHLHDSVGEGDQIEVGPPCGEFVLKNPEGDSPLVLMAGGVGITPLMSMMLSALKAQPDREIVFLHAVRNPEVQAFAPEIAALAARHDGLKVVFQYSEAMPATLPGAVEMGKGFVNDALIRRIAPETEADYYFCGPKPFMSDVHQCLAARSLPPERVHFEFFGPKEGLERL
ncbi:NO-inducible flavohemoprotein [Paracoccaceae bacterium GXU_MW_L88]